MPRPGSEWTTVTISKKALEIIKQVMNESNEEAGYRKFRSISQFIEHAAVNYEEGSDIKGGFRQYFLEKELTDEELKKWRSSRQDQRRGKRRNAPSS